MPQYDFKALSPIDFELLVRDLLQKELNLTLESFKAGRDSGIDFRYSSGAGDLIVQCKHYAESTFPMLLSTIKGEVEKVRKLSPAWYILAVSLGLTPRQKGELIQVLTPFVRDSGDILTRDDLNNLLGRFPEIERHTPKLWLSSTAVFEEILNNKVRNVSRESLARICERSRLYVQNDSFREALSILDSHNVCIIAGIPGIGKTTLAEMLLLHFVNAGYELVQIDHDIGEAQKFAAADVKRVYYYDDFLGQISVGEKLNKNEEQRLLNFMEVIKKSKSSKLILTTREYILNQAKLLYEKVDRAAFDPDICIVDLSKYTRMIRAQILFNHLYFSDLPRPYLDALLANKAYLKIIDHPNYSPRIIEQMTQMVRLRDVPTSDYARTFVHNLTNPAELWRHAFEQQLSEASRSTLVVLSSSFRGMTTAELQQAVESFHLEKCRRFGIAASPRDFHRALKELEGNFVSAQREGPGSDPNGLTITYHNPSVRDFVRNYLATATAELALLIKNAVFFEQLVTLWRYRDDTGSGQAFAKALDCHLGEFLGAAARTLHAVDIANVPSHKLVFRRARMNFERRVNFFVTVASSATPRDVNSHLDTAIATVRRRLAENALDAEDLVGLLATIDTRGFSSLAGFDELLKEAYEYVSDGFDTLDSFLPFIAFIDAFPDQVDHRKLEEVTEEFRSVAESVGDDEDSPERVREVATQVDELAGRFGLDMTERTDELEEWAKECERQSTQAGYDDEGYGRGGYYHGHCSDSDIDSVFSVL